MDMKEIVKEFRRDIGLMALTAGVLFGGSYIAGKGLDFLSGVTPTGRVKQNLPYEVTRHAYEGARGYDVRLGKAMVRGIYVAIGNLNDRSFDGPAIIAKDNDLDGKVDDYHCLECPADSDLLKLANPAILSRIEQELLPYYGQETH